MLLSAHRDLKAAIVAIPPKEKDKLLLRLIAKDKVLTEHLHFKLLENESDLEERQINLQEEIENGIAELLANRKYNSKDTTAVMRKLNGRINHHAKVTKDLKSEVELRINLLNLIPVIYKESVFSALSKFNDKLMVYFVKTTQSVWKKYQKLHEDLQFDLKDQLNPLLVKVHQGKLAKAAEELQIPIEI